MKLTGILPLAFVLASTCAVSQQSGNSAEPSQLTFTRSTALSDCPVGLDVRHGSLLDKKLVQDPSPDAGLDRGMALPETGQRVLLSLTNLRSRDIVSAQLTAHGLSRRGRFVPLADESPVSDMTRSIEIAVSIKGNGRASRNLALSRFAVVTEIDVNSVTYADGSTWKGLAPGACSAQPEMMMLLSAAK